MHRSIEARPAAVSLLRPVLTGIALLAASGARATPVLDLSWDSCSPIVSAKTSTPGVTTYSVFCSVTGMSEPHKAYYISMYFAGEMPCRTNPATPDAWRFDPEGCQGAGSRSVTFASADAACPPLAGPELPPFSIIDVVQSDGGPNEGPTGAMRLVVAASYGGRIQTPDPETRYLAFRIDFDHTHSVTGEGTPGETCGGYESPVCLSLYSGIAFTVMGECGIGANYNAAFLDESGTELEFQIGQAQLGFGLDSGSWFQCFEFLPASSTTWGAIKAQYR